MLALEDRLAGIAASGIERTRIVTGNRHPQFGSTVESVDPREQQRQALAARIAACGLCFDMNIQGETESAPPFGSVYSPVVIVGESLCKKCMAARRPFVGGSARVLESAFRRARITDDQLFITNAVHCHPRDRQPELYEVINCVPHLRDELAIVQPRLVIALGRFSHASVQSVHPGVYPIVWSATDELVIGPAGSTSSPVLFFVKHPAWAMRQPQDVRDKYEKDLADALTWGFTNQR